MTLHIEITSSRLRLVALSRNELQALLESRSILHKELVISFTDGLVDGRVKQAIGRKLTKMADVQLGDHPWLTFWLIIRNDGQEGIGLIGYKGIPDIMGVTEIGYGMVASQQGKGIMTEALRMLTDWGFQSDRCCAVTAITDRSNRASQRVLEKNGFTIKQQNTDEIEWLLVKGDK